MKIAVFSSILILPIHLLSGYWGVFFGGKKAGAWSWLVLSSAEVKNEWSNTATYPLIFMSCKRTNLRLLSPLCFNALTSAIWKQIHIIGYICKFKCFSIFLFRKKNEILNGNESGEVMLLWCYNYFPISMSVLTRVDGSLMVDGKSSWTHTAKTVLSVNGLTGNLG